MKKTVITMLALLAVALVSCEKAVLDEEEEVKDANLTLRVTNVKMLPYDDDTRAAIDITGYSSRLNFVLYENGEKKKSLEQMQGDAGYGQVSMKLAPGNYKVLVLAHSSKGNPTLASPENIKFTNSISFSDTFYYYGDVTVTSEAKTHDVMLARASSMVRFIIEDEIPATVAKVRLHYTGGSAVLNAVTGYGANVNSQQEKLYNIEGLSAPLALPIYTFLQEDEGKLTLTVTAEDKNNNAVLQRTFTDVPVERNKITEYAGTFFEHENGFALMADTAWADTIRVQY